MRIQTQTYETVYWYCYETNLSIQYCSLKLQKENRISGLQKGKFRRPSSAPEARKERSCQSYSASHIKWRAERSFHRPTFIRPGDFVQYPLMQPRTQTSWRYLSYQRTRIFPTRLTGDVTSKIAEDDWERDCRWWEWQEMSLILNCR